ncbi:protein LURP-one-related 15-like [Henckelia pumila]|uniref:protein LURP-one-related 15-like n=1 Tax=Henckelia pumila TaxID=405737 RepID=UPI003C6E481B
MFVPEVRRPAASTSIVGEEFCFPYLVDLTVKKKIGLSSKHFDVLDHNGSMLVHVEGGFWQFKKKRTMYDSVGAPIITMRQKVSWRQEWIVHRGDNLDGSNLLYTVVQHTSPFQLKTQLQVFLASNLTAQICNFRVVGSYMSQSFKVYKGDTVIAEVKQRFKLGSLGKEAFEARIYPGIDYVFIVSLLAILNEIDS